MLPATFFILETASLIFSAGCVKENLTKSSQ
jgi:hypothetical protein